MNKSVHAILEQNYSIVASAKRIVDFQSNQSLHPVETGKIVIATIEKLAPGLDFVFVTWKTICNSKHLNRGICSAAPWKGAAESSLRVGEKLILQINQPARFGKISVLSSQICLITSHMVVWPGKPSKCFVSYLTETPTILRGSPKLRGFTHGIPRVHTTATGPMRWSRQQYRIEADWEKSSLEFVQINTQSSGEKAHRNTSWISWFCRPVCPSIIVKDRMMREYVARCLMTNHPNVPRDFDLGNEHGWATWYNLHSAALTQPKVPLPCGGSLILEATQSGWCIDVNSGTSLETGSKGRANQEAIYALLHQASIRSIYGSLIVDLIPEQNLACLEKLLHTCCYLIQHDPYHTRIVYVSHDGFMRIMRNRIREVF